MYGRTMYKPSAFIANASPLPPITAENLSHVVEKLDVNVRCKILLLSCLRFTLTKGKITRLAVLTNSQLEQIQKAWPVILIKGREYRFFKDGDFLGVERLPKELLIFKKQKARVFIALSKLLTKTEPCVSQLAY